ncbi:hypothetical protein NMG60_11030563 [Bertholletia excelsa]
MGNCSPKGVAKANDPNFIRIMIDSGSIMELEGPKLAGEVLREFPGYGIFGQGHVFSPLLGHEQLHCGQFFYLLPLANEDIRETPMNEAEQAKKTLTGRVGSVVEVLHPPEKGVWRVKLAIDTKQLEGILSEDGDFEYLIEQIRLAATSASGKTKREKMRSGKSGVVDWKAVLKNQQNRVRLQGLCTSRTSQERTANEAL